MELYTHGLLCLASHLSKVDFKVGLLLEQVREVKHWKVTDPFDFLFVIQFALVLCDEP